MVFRETTGYLWVVIVERWILVAVGCIVAKRGDKFGHPVEVAADLFGQFVENLLLVKALILHIKDDGSTDDALVDDSLPVTVCLPLHCIGGKLAEFLPDCRYYRGVGLVVEQRVDEGVVELVDERRGKVGTLVVGLARLRVGVVAADGIYLA